MERKVHKSFSPFLDRDTDIIRYLSNILHPYIFNSLILGTTDRSF